MKALGANEINALAATMVSLRNLIWITVKDRATGAKASTGFWDDVGTVSLQVYDAFTGGVAVRTFFGAGSLLQVDDIVNSAELAVQELTIRLSGIDEQVSIAVRGYDTRLAPIQVYRLIQSPSSGQPYAPARPRFVGVVDNAKIIDPRRGSTGGITLTCVNQMRELSRANPDMTSDESQKERATVQGYDSDKLYEFANAVTKWQIAWGTLSVKNDKDDKKDKDKKKKDKNK